MKLLENLKILDFSTLLPGPFGTWLLSEMGAEVVRISAPNKVDIALEFGEKSPKGTTGSRAWLTKNKSEIFIDLKTKEGVDKVKKMISEDGFNIIMEQFRPGVMEKFGLSYKDIKKICPSIIYCSLSSFGQFGPYSQYAGHDINALALSGLMSFSGRKNQGPVLYGSQIADLAAGTNCALGILAAANKRNLTGNGSHIDVSMLDSIIPFNSMPGVGASVSGKNPDRENDWLNGGSLYDFYETKDGNYLSVGSLEPKFWKRLCEIMNHSDWIEAGMVCSDFKEKKEILRKDFKEKTRDEWVEIFRGKDACVEPVLTVTEALIENEHIKERKALEKININDEDLLVYSNPIKFISL